VDALLLRGHPDVVDEGRCGRRACTAWKTQIVIRIMQQAAKSQPARKMVNCWAAARSNRSPLGRDCTAAVSLITSSGLEPGHSRKMCRERCSYTTDCGHDQAILALRLPMAMMRHT
jgi:hypothetical protein